MTKKQKKAKKPRPLKTNQQIPLSRVRPLIITGPRYYLQHAREYPFLGCWVNADWKESGITPVVVAREQSPDKVTFGVYLMDIYCLGIKDSYANADFPLKNFERKLPRMCSGTPKKCPAELAHEIVYGGMEYAARYGFEPHPDFTAQHADQVLDPPETHPRKHKVKFGKDGKPFYISGPYDDERKINSIINTLMRTAGEGKFDYLIGVGPSEFFED